MAITLTKNLKLKIDSSFDATSVYNLNKLDNLAGILQVNTNNQAIIRSQNDITLLPNSEDLGGSGVGGNITLGSAQSPISSFSVYASSINFSGAGIALSDQAVGGTAALALVYSSSPLDSTDRTLTINVARANRELSLGGDLTLTGSNFLLNFSGLTNGQVLTYNSGTGQWVNADPSAAATSDYVTTWQNTDGAVKTIVHSLGSLNVGIVIYDQSNHTIEIDSEVRSDVNTIILTSVIAPPGTWTVLIKKYGV